MANLEGELSAASLGSASLAAISSLCMSVSDLNLNYELASQSADASVVNPPTGRNCKPIFIGAFTT